MVKSRSGPLYHLSHGQREPDGYSSRFVGPIQDSTNFLEAGTGRRNVPPGLSKSRTAVLLEILATGNCPVFFEIICLFRKKYSKLCPASRHGFGATGA
jgi:hypothetical protein